MPEAIEKSIPPKQEPSSALERHYFEIRCEGAIRYVLLDRCKHSEENLKKCQRKAVAYRDHYGRSWLRINDLISQMDGVLNPLGRA